MKTAVRHHQAGRLEQAEQLYRLVLQYHPGHPVVLHSLAMIAYQAGRYEAALELLREAVADSPQVPQFHNTRGLVLEALGKFNQATQAYERAVSLKPDYAEAYHNMGIAMLAQGQYVEAVKKCRKAISLTSGYAQVYNTMGFCLERQGRCAEAVQSYKRAVQLAPDFAEAHNHLGVVFSAMDRHEEAIEHYRRAVQTDPEYAEAHWNLSLALLLTGRLAAGWKEYEWRCNPGLGMTTYPHCYDEPQWDGSSFAGNRLLVHYEQGLGDTIQFVRYLPAVKARGGTVILEVRKPLIDLLRRFPGVDELVEASLDMKPAMEFDLHVSLMDLPGLLGTTLDNVPAGVPYLYADSAKAGYWREKLSGPDFKVGIVWSGSSMYERNHVRSCRLEYFASLAAVEGIKLYGLQKDGPASQLEELAAQIPVTNLAEHLHDFSDTAAVIENLDLIVSVDTSVPHLAGAMGKPVWVLICSTPAWQWMLDRQDSPWYPTMRLFRQKESGDWQGVFRDVVEQLKILLAKERPGVGRSQTGRACNEKVPVIIPAYKGKDQLEKCIAHLKRQTAPAEIFIRDNNRENIYFTAAINEG
ncbi:MAG: tetratricopeptide repeat protein, partial [Planctomycetota bacterium]